MQSSCIGVADSPDLCFRGPFRGPFRCYGTWPPTSRTDLGIHSGQHHKRLQVKKRRRRRMRKRRRRGGGGEEGGANCILSTTCLSSTFSKPTNSIDAGEFNPRSPLIYSMSTLNSLLFVVPSKFVLLHSSNPNIHSENIASIFR